MIIAGVVLFLTAAFGWTAAATKDDCLSFCVSNIVYWFVLTRLISSLATLPCASCLYSPRWVCPFWLSSHLWRNKWTRAALWRAVWFTNWIKSTRAAPMSSARKLAHAMPIKVSSQMRSLPTWLLTLWDRQDLRNVHTMRVWWMTYRRLNTSQSLRSSRLTSSAPGSVNHQISTSSLMSGMDRQPLELANQRSSAQSTSMQAYSQAP